MPRRHLGAALILAAVVLLAMPALALADAELESATPAPDSTVGVAPSEVIATFTAALDGAKSSLEVRDAAGSVVARSGADSLAADEVTMTLPLPALANGTYEVRWTAAAQDTHITRGTYEFTVAVAPSPSPSPSQSPSSSPIASASPSSPPSPGASPGPSPGPSGDGSGSGAADTSGLDLSTLLPIAAALVVVVAIAAYFMRNRRR